MIVVGEMLLLSLGARILYRKPHTLFRHESNPEDARGFPTFSDKADENNDDDNKTGDDKKNEEGAGKDEKEQKEERYLNDNHRKDDDDGIEITVSSSIVDFSAKSKGDKNLKDRSGSQRSNKVLPQIRGNVSKKIANDDSSADGQRKQGLNISEVADERKYKDPDGDRGVDNLAFD